MMRETVSAKMMFVPEKVMNRQETHLNECLDVAREVTKVHILFTPKD